MAKLQQFEKKDALSQSSRKYDFQKTVAFSWGAKLLLGNTLPFRMFCRGGRSRRTGDYRRANPDAVANQAGHHLAQHVANLRDQRRPRHAAPARDRVIDG